MYGNILELSKRNSKGGRRAIKMALLTIHDKADTNLNGIHWNEQYVLNNLDSIRSIPICAEFCEENKRIPLGHGLSEIIEVDGRQEPLFENSDVVGSIETASIEELSLNGKRIKVLMGYGYLYNQRYPQFTEWVKENLLLNSVKSSIEIMGYAENDNQIIYEEHAPSPSYRTPKDFSFSAIAILSIKEADENAYVLEVAQKNNKEEITLDQKEIKQLIVDTINETNSKNDSLTAKIAELTSALAKKEKIIADMNAEKEALQKETLSLKEEKDKSVSEKNSLEKELDAKKAEQSIDKLDKALSQFSDAEKEYAAAEIKTFKEAPLEGNIDAIVSKIYAGIGSKAKKDAVESKQVAEQNAAKNEYAVEDIFSEVNSITNNSINEDINIF